MHRNQGDRATVRMVEYKTDHLRDIGRGSIILLTGAVGDHSAEKYTKKFESVGLEGVTIPPYMFEFTNSELVKETLFGADRPKCSGLIITSKRAALLLSDVLTAASDDLCVGSTSLCYTELPVYTVGPATSLILESLGFKDIRGKDSGSATALAQKIKQDFEMGAFDTTGPLNFLCGNKRREDIPIMLEASHIPHQMITVYKTVRNPDIAYALRKACADKPVDWLVFFSPSGVEFCLDCLPKANAKFAAIGPTTAQKLRDCGVVVSAVAATPNPDGLIKAVLSVSNSKE